jgi:hypothetical protein
MHRPMALRDANDRPSWRYHVKAHTFRTFTVILAWILIVAAFYQAPEILTGAQRLLQRGIEDVGDQYRLYRDRASNSFFER